MNQSWIKNKFTVILSNQDDWVSHELQDEWWPGASGNGAAWSEHAKGANGIQPTRRLRNEASFSWQLLVYRTSPKIGAFHYIYCFITCPFYSINLLMLLHYCRFFDFWNVCSYSFLDSYLTQMLFRVF